MLEYEQQQAIKILQSVLLKKYADNEKEIYYFLSDLNALPETGLIK
ncbi:MAG: hypothetical protein IPJ20_23565 [Flammeovirgaceae bacterium]|nr:hypothetical protein [Flammeovirgaceae bacterium]